MSGQSGVTEDLVEKGAKAIGAHYNDDPEWYRRDLASAVLAAVVPEVRRAVAEEIAAKANELANEFQDRAVIHRDLADSRDPASPMKESHWKTALAFRNKADGAWAVAHAAREIGGVQ